MLIVDFDYNANGNTVPYPPLADDIRRNRGFVDLRGRPDLAAQIAETADCKALKDLLIQLASPAAPLCTLGCDIGETETQFDAARRFTAGGYIQWVLAPPTEYTTDEYDAFGRALADALEPMSERYLWALTIVGQYVDLTLDERTQLVPSHWIWFDAYAASPNAARSSREALLTALARLVADIDLMRLIDRGNAEDNQTN